jgi:hypothetical protein
MYNGDLGGIALAIKLTRQIDESLRYKISARYVVFQLVNQRDTKKHHKE